MPPFLSVCVPTYNRRQKLAECLGQLLPQAERHGEVEIVVSDNASTDDTPTFLASLPADPRVRILRNETNLGMDGNTLALMAAAQGEYVAFLSDDDIPTDAYLDSVLAALRVWRPSMLYLNYYAFWRDWRLSVETFFPEEDVEFRTLGQGILYCGLSHFSAVVVEKAAAVQALEDIRHAVAQKVSRGYAFGSFAYGALAYGTRGGRFLGRRVLANRAPERVDYDVITNTCIDNPKGLIYWNSKGLLSDDDLRAKIRQVGGGLPAAIASHRIRNGLPLTFRLWRELATLYGDSWRFWIINTPLALMPAVLLRPLYRLGVAQKMRLKRLRWI